MRISAIWSSLLFGIVIGAAPGCLGESGSSGDPAEAQLEQALTGYQVITAETSVDTSSSRYLEVACPQGTKVLGAGWGVLDPTSAILEGVATYFEPSFDGASWLVIANKTSSFATSWKLQLRVLCGVELAGYEIVGAETELTPASSKYLDLACPADKVLLGAGWSVLDPTSAILDGEARFFGPNGAGWLIFARNRSSFAPSWKLHGRLVCVNAAAVAGYEVVTIDTPVNTDQVKYLDTSCPTGKHATSHGWSVLDSTSAILDGRASFSQAAFDGASWLTFARNFSAFAPAWKLRGQAVCTL